MSSDGAREAREASAYNYLDPRFSSERAGRAATSRPCLRCRRYIYHEKGARLCVACTRGDAAGASIRGEGARPGAPDPNLA